MACLYLILFQLPRCLKRKKTSKWLKNKYPPRYTNSLAQSYHGSGFFPLLCHSQCVPFNPPSNFSLDKVAAVVLDTKQKKRDYLFLNYKYISSLSNHFSKFSHHFPPISSIPPFMYFWLELSYVSSSKPVFSRANDWLAAIFRIQQWVWGKRIDSLNNRGFACIAHGKEGFLSKPPMV